jgi:hypothetical protein
MYGESDGRLSISKPIRVNPLCRPVSAVRPASALACPCRCLRR